MVSPILELTNINKSFGHVHANKNINLTINKGTIHGIIGENGAGKSTLMSIVFGLYQAFALAQYSFYDASFAMVEWVVGIVHGILGGAAIGAYNSKAA